MNEPPDSASTLRCSFCNKPYAEVQKLIAGNKDVAICNECVEVCTDIIADTFDRPPSSNGHEPDEPDLFLSVPSVRASVESGEKAMTPSTPSPAGDGVVRLLAPGAPSRAPRQRTRQGRGDQNHSRARVARQLFGEARRALVCDRAG